MNPLRHWTDLTTPGPGQLLAFSGLDGPTDIEHGLIARTGEGTVSMQCPWGVVPWWAFFPTGGLSGWRFRLKTKWINAVSGSTNGETN